MNQLRIEEMEPIYKMFEYDQARKAVQTIDKEELAEFWQEYRLYLFDLFVHKEDALFTFSEHILAYFRVKGR